VSGTEDAERRHLSELFGPVTGEVTDAGRTAAYFVADDPDYPYLTVSTLGLAAGAEPYELGIQRDGVHSGEDAERIARAFLAAVQRLAGEGAVIAPERVVAIPELEPEFPGRALALVSDFMYRGPDMLPTADGRARWLLLRPIFGDELRWIRTMSQAQIGETFAKAGVRLEDSTRDALLVRVTPRIVPSEKEVLAMAPPKADIKGLYASLETWLADHAPQQHGELQPPASAEDLSALEAALGQAIPEELREALELHDGRVGLDSYMIMPAARIQQRYTRKMESADQESPEPGDGTCKPVVWTKGWIPFAEDGAQNFLCIDLDPGKKGAKGQVIRWERDSQGADAAPWKSFGEWLKAMVDACVGGKVDIDGDGNIFLK
jgi:cell wall assembly regulator SMI1